MLKTRARLHLFSVGFATSAVKGKYFCDKACVVAYNKRKVEEHERLLETLEEEEDRAKVAPPAVLEVT